MTDRSKQAIMTVCTFLSLVLASMATVPVAQARGLSPRTLVASDFFGATGATSVSLSGGQAETIAAVPYLSYLSFLCGKPGNGGDASISLNAATLVGYNALSFSLGMSDKTYAHGSSGELQVQRDGHAYATYHVSSGVPARHVIVFFGGHKIITLDGHYDTGGGSVELLVAVPMAIVVGPALPIPLSLNAPYVVAGGTQTAIVATTAASYVTLVITYGSGAPLVVGPKLIGPDGKYTYTWTLPAAQRGRVRVTLIDGAGKVTQSSFTITG